MLNTINSLDMTFMKTTESPKVNLSSKYNYLTNGQMHNKKELTRSLNNSTTELMS